MLIVRLTTAMILIGCASTQPVAQPESQKKTASPPRYKIGDCLMIVDPSTGSKPTPHRVRVEKINLQIRRYYYRWLLDVGKWDKELSSGVGKFEVLEKISQKVDCP
jgi:hypothetical protein